MAMKDGSDDLLSRTKLLSLELLQVCFLLQYKMNLLLMKANPSAEVMPVF